MSEVKVRFKRNGLDETTQMPFYNGQEDYVSVGFAERQVQADNAEILEEPQGASGAPAAPPPPSAPAPVEGPQQ